MRYIASLSTWANPTRFVEARKSGAMRVRVTECDLQSAVRCDLICVGYKARKGRNTHREERGGCEFSTSVLGKAWRARQGLPLCPPFRELNSPDIQSHYLPTINLKSGRQASTYKARPGMMLRYREFAATWCVIGRKQRDRLQLDL
jgi:hypothetical protein